MEMQAREELVEQEVQAVFQEQALLIAVVVEVVELDQEVELICQVAQVGQVAVELVAVKQLQVPRQELLTRVVEAVVQDILLQQPLMEQMVAQEL
jgi:hypothetical protein